MDSNLRRIYFWMTPLAWGSSLSSQYQRFYPTHQISQALAVLCLCLSASQSASWILKFIVWFNFLAGITIDWWCQKFRFSSGYMFVIRNGIFSQSAVNIISGAPIKKATTYMYLTVMCLVSTVFVGLINIFTNPQNHGASCIWSIL